MYLSYTSETDPVDVLVEFANSIRYEALEEAAVSIDLIIADWPDEACESGSFLTDEIRALKSGERK